MLSTFSAAGARNTLTGALLGGGGSWGACDPPLGRPSFEQTTYNIQVAKTL